MLQRIADASTKVLMRYDDVDVCVTGCIDICDMSHSVMQCVAVSCSVFKCVAVCCSVLQCDMSHRRDMPRIF